MNIRREAADLVRALGCPPGAGISEIQSRVAAAHGKEIHLIAVGDDDLRTMTGLWVETESASHVFYREADPVIYRTHSIFHEFGHIIANHQTCGVLSFIDSSTVDSATLGGQIIRARGRGFQFDEAEELAEQIAYELSQVVISGASTGIRAAFE